MKSNSWDDVALMVGVSVVLSILVAGVLAIADMLLPQTIPQDVKAGLPLMALGLLPTFTLILVLLGPILIGDD